MNWIKSNGFACQRCGLGGGQRKSACVIIFSDGWGEHDSMHWVLSLQNLNLRIDHD